MAMNRWCLVILVLALGCRHTKVAPPTDRVPATMPEIAFNILKENEPRRLAEIVMSASDFVEFMRAEIKAAGVTMPEAEIKSRSVTMAEAALAKAERSLTKVRTRIGATGFDWSTANLSSVTTDTGPYDSSSIDPHLDIYLTIESGTNSVVVKLDDCFWMNGHRKLADGFWVDN